MAKLHLLATVKVARETTLRPGAIIEVKDPEDEQVASLVARGFARWVKPGDEAEGEGELHDAIDAATDAAAVLAVDITAGWPD